MEQLLSGAWNTPAIIAGLAIVVANVVIWLWGGDWTPRKRALVGIGAVCVVLGIGYWAAPDSYPETRQGMVNLVALALLVVLAAAGAPVMKETFLSPKPETPEVIDVTDHQGVTRTVEVIPAPEETPGKTWGVWSRK